MNGVFSTVSGAKSSASRVLNSAVGAKNSANGVKSPDTGAFNTEIEAFNSDSGAKSPARRVLNPDIGAICSDVGAFNSETLYPQIESYNAGIVSVSAKHMFDFSISDFTGSRRLLRMRRRKKCYGRHPQ